MQKQQDYDLVVVGAGCVGAGIALDASSRGLSCLLLDENDFASGTSSRSTKLLWAGSRYLVNSMIKLISLHSLSRPIESLEEFWATFKMVCKCHRERSFLLESNPHLTRWIPLVVPIESWILWPPPFGYFPACLGPLGLFSFFFHFYDFLGNFSSPHSHILPPSMLKEKIPSLTGKAETLKYGQVFYEGLHDDARTCLSIILRAVRNFELTALNYCSLKKINFVEGKLDSLDLHDEIEKTDFQIRTRSVVLACGPRTDEFREKDPVVRISGGTHIVVDEEKFFSSPDYGCVDMQTRDGRFMFILPWLGKTLIGTTDNGEGPEKLVPSEDVDWLLEEATKMFRGLELSRDDVKSCWHGLRALESGHEDSNVDKVSRDHFFGEDREGVFYIAGGKWTTYREMAEEMVDTVIQRLGVEAPCRTREIALAGAYEREGKNLKEVEKKLEFLDERIRKHLINSYGTNSLDLIQYGKLEPLHPGCLYLDSELDYQIEHELVEKPLDILCRRTRLAFLDSEAALALLPRVCEVLEKKLSWSKRRRLEEETKARETLVREFFPRVQ